MSEIVNIAGFVVSQQRFRQRDIAGYIGSPDGVGGYLGQDFGLGHLFSRSSASAAVPAVEIIGWQIKTDPDIADCSRAGWQDLRGLKA